MRHRLCSATLLCVPPPLRFATACLYHRLRHRRRRVRLGLVPLREPVLGLFGESFLVASTSLLWLLAAAFAVHIGAPLMTAAFRKTNPKRPALSSASRFRAASTGRRRS